jgi:dTDP-4-amino-4,6-dideoxygalactose transaminase
MNKIKLKLDKLVDKLYKKGISSRKLWQPMHLSNPHKNSQYITNNNISNSLYKTCLSLPSSADLTNSEQIKIINTFKKVLSSYEKS